MNQEAQDPPVARDARPDPLQAMHRLGERGRWLLIALLVITLVFIFFATIDGAVISPGVVKVDLNRKQVQHQEGGIVKAVLVRDGQQVAQGDVLIELADVSVDASVELLRNQVDAEQARNARLRAEKDYQSVISFPQGLVARRADPTVADILNKERGLFVARRQTLESQMALIEAQIREAQQEEQALERQLAADQDSIRLQREELDSNAKLLDENYVQKSRILTLQRAVGEYDSRIGGEQAELAKTRQKIIDLRLRLLSQRNDYIESATKELRESTNDAFDLEQRLRPSVDAEQRQRITAPVSGEVINLRITPGMVVGPRDVVAEIVPTQAKLVIEGQIRPQDITHAHIGADVDVRLTAFGYWDTPVVAGRLTYVSADSLVNRENGVAFYTIMVEVSSQALKTAGSSLYMQAGMPAEIFIKTTPRTVAGYLFEPLTSYMSRALREP